VGDVTATMALTVPPGRTWVADVRSATREGALVTRLVGEEVADPGVIDGFEAVTRTARRLPMSDFVTRYVAAFAPEIGEPLRNH
jgi:hypothetical protein